jgi:SAM-dependent methyltransferase
VTEPAAASRGLPSFVWRAGQVRRLAMIRRYARVEGVPLLDVGCGVGAYTAELADAGAHALGVEIEWVRARDARERGLDVVVAHAEALPFAGATFSSVLLHEVLEHVADDRAALREAVRVLVPGGRAVVFVPNRWWPFETHGVVWRGRYRFGNAPLVNYLPDVLRNRLAPHVRVYTRHALVALLDALPVFTVVHTAVFPGYDKLEARRPRLGAAVRRISHALERTPLRRLGLSHLLVVERRPE